MEAQDSQATALIRRPPHLAPDSLLDVEDPILSRSSSRRTTKHVDRNHQALRGVARHTLGLLLLLVVVFLWTFQNFLGSSIFADNSYAKPFFLTYLNTSCFTLAMIPVLVRSGYQRYRDGRLSSCIGRIFSPNRTRGHRLIPVDESEAFLKPDEVDDASRNATRQQVHLGFRPTARLSLAFCMLWFFANYFAMASLQHTSVASATILTSTSSIWTLVVGTLTGTDKFTWRKLGGVLGSLLGIIIISRVDFTSPKPSPDPAGLHTRVAVSGLDKFPDKRPAELALGDLMALFSAIIYGFYTITLKWATLKASPLHLSMPLFFGFVGLFNVLLLSPFFPILHWTGIEEFQAPPTRRIWTILMVNAFSSLASDICWAYSMVLTSPIVVTVGLSLSIPLSLVGQIFLQSRTEGGVYWIGAAVVVASFAFVARAEADEDEAVDGIDAAQPVLMEASLEGLERPVEETRPRDDDRQILEHEDRQP